MENENNTFLDVRSMPGTSVGFRTIKQVRVLEDWSVVVGYSDGSEKPLPSVAPRDPVNIVGAEIRSGDLILIFDDASEINAGRVNPTRTYSELVVIGEGLLTNPTTAKFKPLVAVGTYLTIEETDDAVVISLDQTGAPGFTPSATGSLSFQKFLFTSTNSSVVTDGYYYVPYSFNSAWNAVDIAHPKYSTLEITYNPDKSFVLPAGHYFMDFATSLFHTGLVRLELWNVTDNQKLLQAVGLEHGASSTANVHASLIMRGDFYLDKETTLTIKAQASSALYYLGISEIHALISENVGCQMALWKVSDGQVDLATPPVRAVSEWEQHFAGWSPTNSYAQTTGVFPVTYSCATAQLFSCFVKCPSGDNYLIPAAHPKFMFLSDDGLVKVEMAAPINITGGGKQFGRKATLANDGNIYCAAYNALQHLRIVPMRIGGDLRPDVLENEVSVGYDYFARPIPLHDSHVTVTAPATTATYAPILNMFKNEKFTGVANSYYSAASATPELVIGLRLPVTLKGMRISNGAYGVITAASLYRIDGSTRTLLGDFAQVGSVMTIDVVGGTPCKDYAVVVTAAEGAPGAIRFGTNGIQMLVAEQVDLSRPEGVVELIPNAQNSSVTAKYELAQASPSGDEVMFIPVSNFDTRGGFEFYDTVLNKWRRSTYGLTVPAANIFSSVVCSPANDHIYIFGKTVGGNNYVYDPVAKKIKQLAQVSTLVDVAINGKNGLIYGFGTNTQFAAMVDPVNNLSWDESFGDSFLYNSELMNVRILPSGKFWMQRYNGYFQVLDVDEMVATNIVANTWMYLCISRMNGDTLQFINRRLSGGAANIGNYYLHNYNGGVVPAPETLIGPYA